MLIYKLLPIATKQHNQEIKMITIRNNKTLEVVACVELAVYLTMTAADIFALSTGARAA
jgi:hypothetical protein